MNVVGKVKKGLMDQERMGTMGGWMEVTTQLGIGIKLTIGSPSSAS